MMFKKIYRIIMLSVWVLVQALVACGQSTENCKGLVYEIYRTPKPQDNVVYYANYSVKMVERKAVKTAVENKVKVYADKTHKQLITSSAQMYADSKYCISMMPQSRVIAINTTTDQLKEELKKLDPSSMDSLFFSDMAVESCKTITTSDRYNKEITLIPIQKISSVKRIKYLVNEQKKQMYKVYMYYPDSSPYNYAEYTYYEVNYNYTEKKIDQPVYDLFFKKDGTLLAKYKGYSVIDNRLTSSNRNSKK